MDFYQLLFGRPSPGTRRRAAFDHALFGRGKQVTRETPAQVSSRADYEGEAPPLPPEWAPRLSPRGRYRAGPRVPAVALEGELPPFPFPMPGDAPGEFVPPAERVRLREAGEEDFVAWLERGERPLPSVLEAHEGEEPVRFAWGSDARGGEAMNEPRPYPDQPRGVEPPSDPRATSRFDVDAEWEAAEARARERWRRGEPSPVDVFLAIVQGRRPRLERVEEDTEAMRREMRGQER